MKRHPHSFNFVILIMALFLLVIAHVTSVALVGATR